MADFLLSAIAHKNAFKIRHRTAVLLQTVKLFCPFFCLFCSADILSLKLTKFVHIGIQKHTVDRLAKSRRKDIKLLDETLSFKRSLLTHDRLKQSSAIYYTLYS